MKKISTITLFIFSYFLSYTQNVTEVFGKYDTSYYLLDKKKIIKIDKLFKDTWIHKVHPYDTCENYGSCSGGSFGIFSEDSIEITNKCGHFKGTVKEWDKRERIKDSINKTVDSITKIDTWYEVKESKYYILDNNFKPIKRIYIRYNYWEVLKFIGKKKEFYDPVYRKKHEDEISWIEICG